MSTSEDVDKFANYVWTAAQIAAIWSGIGFALAFTVSPGAINMGIGVGIWAVMLTILGLFMDTS